MDPQARKQLLAQKLQENWQRRDRERYLARLPGDLNAYLASCACLYTPALDAFCNQWYPFDEHGLGTMQKITDHYCYRELCWSEDALRVAESFDPDYDNATAILVTGMSSSYAASFVVTFGWARTHLARLWPFGSQQIAVVCRDLLSGIVIDNYASSPYDPEPRCEDVTFELGYWAAQPIITTTVRVWTVEIRS